jgi:hypothetical protein
VTHPGQHYSSATECLGYLWCTTLNHVSVTFTVAERKLVCSVVRETHPESSGCYSSPLSMTDKTHTLRGHGVHSVASCQDEEPSRRPLRRPDHVATPPCSKASRVGELPTPLLQTSARVDGRSVKVLTSSRLGCSRPMPHHLTRRRPTMAHTPPLSATLDVHQERENGYGRKKSLHGETK